MKLFFLKAAVPLTKTYERMPDKSVRKQPYPHVFNVTSVEESYSDIKDFGNLIVKYAQQGFCLVKGELTHPLNNESRAGSTNTMDETSWICLDVDGLPNVTDVEELLDELGLSGVSYVVQYSAGYKVENNNLRCHIYIMLDKRYAAPTIKQWLIHLNLTTPMLASAIKLTRTGNTLHWPLDISTCQNDKLIYIATPQFKNMKDPLPSGRIKYVRKARSKLSLNGFIPNPAVNKEQTKARIDTLRVAAGLPKRREVYKTIGTVEYLSKADQAVITEMRTDRGFVYFNLNGGDSWAYYHPESNPQFIYNFKNEPTYLTKELLPDYWASVHKKQTDHNAATSHQGAQTTQTGIIRLAFCDAKTSVYYRGYYDPATDFLELNAAKSEKQIRDYAKQHNMPLGDFIPEWNYIFDPTSTTRVDVANKIVNMFQPSQPMLTWMRYKSPKVVSKCPPVTLRVINHVLGHDPAAVEHFINWIAYILQTRSRARTAWVFQGTTGTGKGVLMNKVLRPLFGEAHTTMRRMEELNEQYNHFMQSTFLVFVDEVQTSTLRNEKGVMAKLKNFITEPLVAIRRMYANAVEVPNHTNWIFASNQPDPVSIDKEDRRINVGRYQPNSITLSDKDIDTLSTEIQAFHDFLMCYPIDERAAATPLNTADRQQLMAVSENSADTVSSALRDGNFVFFMEQLPTSNYQSTDPRDAARYDNYKNALVSILDRTQKNGTCAIARDELLALFQYTVGGMPETPNKFTSYLRHHRIHVTAVWNGTKTVNGMRTVWTDTSSFKAYRDQLRPPIPAKGKK